MIEKQYLKQIREKYLRLEPVLPTLRAEWVAPVEDLRHIPRSHSTSRVITMKPSLKTKRGHVVHTLIMGIHRYIFKFRNEEIFEICTHYSVLLKHIDEGERKSIWTFFSYNLPRSTF